LSFVVVFIWNLIALFAYSDEPCDQPLKYYLVTVFLFGQTMQPLQRALLQGRSPIAMRTIRFLGTLPGIILVCWGLSMINSCKTCQETNSGLYYPTKYFIYQQIALMCLIGLASSAWASGGAFWLGLHGLLPRTGLGCEQAVLNLPKVSPDATELIDEEDGTVMDCPICSGSFAGEGEPGPPKAVVRTNCNHYFHEECLAKWCKKHVDCPLCRQQVGEIDDPRNPSRQRRPNPIRRTLNWFRQRRQPAQTTGTHEP